MSYPNYGTFSPAASTEDDVVEPDVTPVEEPDEAPYVELHSARPAKKPSRKPARTSPLTAAQVRRVLTQAEVVENLHDETRTIIAAALGAEDTVEDLVVAVILGVKVNPIDLILTLASHDDHYERMTEAITLAADRATLRRVWDVLTALELVTGGVPSKDVQTGIAIAKATEDLSYELRDSLTAASAVLA